MTPTRLMPVLAFAALAACGGGSGSLGALNPFNWFGGRDSNVVLTPTEGYTDIVDRRGLVDQVTELRSESVVGGLVLHAVGLPPTQGYWKADLVSDTDFVPDEKGVLTLQFKVYPPLEATRVSTQQSREVVVGLYLTRQKLETVREIRVVAQRNVRSLRR